MGILSSTISITRYKVEGRFDKSFIETIREGLKRHVIRETDDVSEKIVGWTAFDSPFIPDFEKSFVLIGPYLVFSLRIDKKSIPSRVIKKHFAIEAAKRLAASGRAYLSRDEKKEVKDHVINVLLSRIPATPGIYDIIWNYEKSSLWFFSNLKSANQELETLFSRSFKLTLIRLFPYTTADLFLGFSSAVRDRLSTLSPTNFTE